MPNYIYEVKSVTGQLMRVYEDKIELTQKGAIGFLTQGLKGTKTYFYSDISTIQFKNCGMTAGFFEFTFSGGNDKKGGVFSGSKNDNRFTFGKPTLGAAKKLAVEMNEINEYIQNKLKECKTTKTIINSAPSEADEIKKFKELLDQGIITQEEFDLKKKQLLGI